MKFLIKRIIEEFLKKIGLYYNVIYHIGRKNKNKFISYRNDKKIFFLMTPTYGNLGDQAIDIATMKFFADEFSEFKIIRVALEDTYANMKAIENVIGREDLVFLQGGGNFGNLYLEVERARRFIVKKLEKNKIISMPSTVTYSENRKGRRELKKSQKIYNNHKSLILIAREKYSYEFQLKNFSCCKSILNPDMVFYLWNGLDDAKRNGLLLCIRADQESSITKNRSILISQIYKNFEDVMITDTQLSRGIDEKVKCAEVQSALRFFAAKKVVITDRLHGLIFSIITNTPCIVLPSLDKKIPGTYMWVNELEHISMIDTADISKIEKEIERLLLIENVRCLDFNGCYFNVLKKEIMK